MDWDKLGELIADSAPLLGSALGPVGAAGGAVIASIFGTKNNPDDIAAAIKADPNAALKLKEIELKNSQDLTKIALEAGTARIKSVNQTIQTESKSDKWWVSGWRPFWGYTSAVAWAFLAISIGSAIWRGDGLEVALNTFTTIPESFWLIPLAILGVASWHRGKEKRIKAGEKTNGDQQYDS